MPVGLRNHRAALLEQGFKETVNDFSTVNVALCVQLHSLAHAGISTDDT